MHKILVVANFQTVKFIVKTWALALLFYAAIWGQEFSSNLDIIETETTTVLDSVCAVHLNKDSVQLSLDIDGLGAENRFFIRNCILNNFPGKGWSMLLKDGGERLVLTKFEARVSYHEASASLIGLDKKIRREIVVKLKGRVELFGPDRVAGSFDLKRSIRDTIKTESIADIEKSPYAFTRGRLETFSRWSRFAEPGIAIFSIVSMIYLFFSVRF